MKTSTTRGKLKSSRYNVCLNLTALKASSKNTLFYATHFDYYVLLLKNVFYFYSRRVDVMNNYESRESVHYSKIAVQCFLSLFMLMSSDYCYTSMAHKSTYHKFFTDYIPRKKYL